MLKKTSNGRCSTDYDPLLPISAHLLSTVFLGNSNLIVLGKPKPFLTGHLCSDPCIPRWESARTNSRQQTPESEYVHDPKLTWSG